MNNFKEPLKLGGILGAIALVISVMLAFVNSVTADRIAQVNAEIVQEGLRAAMPAADHFIPMDGTDLENSYGIAVGDVYLAMDAGDNVIGYCATALPDGYGGAVETVVGVDLNGIITGVKVTNNMSETPGLGAKAVQKENFTYQFEGKQSPFAVVKDGGEIDAITSATITSRAVTSGVNAAVEVMNKNSIYGSYAQDGEIIDGKYVIPAQKPDEPEESEEVTEQDGGEKEAEENEQA